MTRFIPVLLGKIRYTSRHGRKPRRNSKHSALPCSLAVQAPHGADMDRRALMKNDGIAAKVLFPIYENSRAGACGRSSVRGNGKALTVCPK